MPETLRFLLLCFAFVFFLLAGFEVSTPRFSFGWFGLAALTAALWLR